MKHTDIIEQLSLAEKCSLLSGLDFWNIVGIEHAGIPALKMSDGPHGLRRQAGAEDHLGLNGSVPATCFPTASALASGWDTELVHEIGEALGREAAAGGVGMLLGPGLCLKRDPLCGRNFEYFSEDPVLSGKLAASMIRGIQSVGISACAKHFAVNNQETRRLTIDAVTDERSLRELYLRSFETAVKEGKPLGIMSAYNRLNGVYCSENEWLLTEVLREDWGYEGLVVTDWGAGNDRVEQLKAGGNIEMPSTLGETDREVMNAVISGELDESVLDLRVDEIIDVMLSAKRGTDAAKTVDLEAHNALARRAAAQTSILLKNEGGLLPLQEGAKVAVIGDFAETPRYQGAGSSLVNPTELADRSELDKAGLNVVGFAKGFLRYGGRSKRLTREAVELAKRADTVLLYIGLDEFSEVEGLDRSHMRMPENQLELLDAVYAVNPNIVALLFCGSPVEMDWADKVKAILHCNLGGQAVLGAAADLVTGKAEPSGRLAESYPYRYEDAPTCGVFPGGRVTSEYREGLYVGYRYYHSANVPVRYPFGWGLSYTSFTLDKLEYVGNTAKVTVTNTGERDGAQVVQLYAEVKAFGVYRPKRELVGFAKAFIKAGETKILTVDLCEHAFEYWDTDAHRWLIETGEYLLLAGTSCEDTPLSMPIAVKGAAAKPRKRTLEPYYNADVKHIDDAVFTALLGREIPCRVRDPRLPVGVNDVVGDGKSFGGFAHFLSATVGFAGRVLLFFGKRSEASYVSVALQMPYRSMWRCTNSAFSHEMLNGVTLMCNRHFFKGLSAVLKGNKQKKYLQKPIYDKPSDDKSASGL